MQAKKYSIRQWLKDDRPREKLLGKGVAGLSNSELIAILLQNGTRNRSALDLARDLLHLAKDNLAELGKLSVHKLMKINGIGEAKAVTILAAMELGRRKNAATIREKGVITSSADVAAQLQALLRDY